MAPFFIEVFMGLFKSKKKTYRDVSFARLIDDDNLPNVIGQAITQYVLSSTNTDSLADLMLEYGWKAINVKWNSAYRYANTAGKYSYGLPKSNLVAETDFTGADSLDEVLQTLTGQSSLTYVYSKFADGNFRHAMYQLLISTYGYTPTDNILTTLSKSVGQTCYLYDATNYITPETKQATSDTMLAHWGYSPTSGATMSRAQNLDASDTPDSVSQTGKNFARVEYTYNYAGMVKTTTTKTTTVTTVTKTPDGSGGYTSESSSSSSEDTSNSTDWNGFKDPDNLISKAEFGHNTETTNTAGTPSTTSSTDADTGVITEVTTQVDTKVVKDSYGLTLVAYFDMSFGKYDYNPDHSTIDTSTVLNDDDSGNYDPNAALIPSGESTDSDPDYFMVCYTYSTSGSTHIGYFTYQYGSGNYPALDGITGTTVSDFGKLYPRLYYRLEGNNLYDDKYADTDAYKTSVRMGTRVNIPWAKMGANILSGLSSVDKVRDVYIMMAVPANTINAIEERYLFEYFYTLYNLRKAVPVDQVSKENQAWNIHEGTEVISEDTAISTRISTGNMGYQKLSGSIGGAGSTKSGYTDGYHWYQYQATDVATYEEVRIWDLSSGVTVGGNNISKSGDDSNLMVPLDYAFRTLFGTHKRETLFARAAQVVIGTEYTVKTKWYQTSVFKVVLTIAAVVAAWYTGGASLSLSAALVAAGEAVASQIALRLLSKYVFTQLGAFGQIVGIVVAVVAIAYGGYLAATNTTGVLQLTASDMLSISNVGFKASQAATQGEMAKVQHKMDSLNSQIEADKTVLHQAKDELNTNSNSLNGYDFFGAIAQYTTPGETPEAFYGRTLNTNIGLVALQSPDISIKQGLTLPSSEETLATLRKSLYPAPVEGLDITLE